ncbi:MAG TPA: efflux RND transporter periplasmic adaptor subunit [Lacipirellulaceae bacterium]
MTQQPEVSTEDRHRREHAAWLRAKAPSAPDAEQRRPGPAAAEPFEDEQVRQPRLTAFFGRLREWLKRLILVLLLFGAVGLLYYRYVLAPTTVVSHEIATGELVSEVMGTGTLEARIKVTVSTKIAGRITEVLVDQGDEVQAGQMLVRLDGEDFKRQVEVEQANVAAGKAALDRLFADKAYAKATLDFATRSHERARGLVASKAVSQEDFDQIVASLTMAKAALERAEAAIVEGQKQLIAAQQTLEFQKARLADTVIAAPFAGLIVRRDRDPGDVVVPGTSVVSLISLNEVWVRAWVDESEMARLKPGQSAKVVFRSEPDCPYTGRVVRLGRESDRETREFLVDILPNKLPANWSVGQRAEVFVETARKSDVLLLPTQYLLRKAGATGTFVAVDDKAIWRPLEFGLRGRQAVEVTAGLQSGDLVVAPLGPKERPLADGRRVVVR